MNGCLARPPTVQSNELALRLVLEEQSASSCDWLGTILDRNVETRLSAAIDQIGVSGEVVQAAKLWQTIPALLPLP